MSEKTKISARDTAFAAAASNCGHGGNSLSEPKNRLHSTSRHSSHLPGEKAAVRDGNEDASLLSLAQAMPCEMKYDSNLLPEYKHQSVLPCSMSIAAFRASQVKQPLHKQAGLMDVEEVLLEAHAHANVNIDVDANEGPLDLALDLGSSAWGVGSMNCRCAMLTSARMIYGLDCLYFDRYTSIALFREETIPTDAKHEAIHTLPHDYCRY